MFDGPIGVFGGTFDPVHNGHLLIASELRFALKLERVLFVPAGDPPHKPAMPLTAAEDRLRMLELALADRDGFAIDRTDLERAGRSYTAELLRLIGTKYPARRLVFLMGDDSLRDLHTWKDPETILALAEIGVAHRPGFAVELDRVYARLPAARGRVHVVDVPQTDFASNDIRRRVRDGHPIAFHVPQDVERYILENRLYRANADR